MSSLDSTSPFSYCPFLCSPPQQNSLKDLTIQDSLFSPPIICHHILIRLLPPPPPPPPETASPRSLISVLLSSMVKAQSSSHLMHQRHWIQLITFNFLETLSSLGMQSYTLAASFPGLSSSPSPALGPWTSPISPRSLLGSRGFKYYLCVDDCQTMLPHWTSPLKSGLIRPTIYSAIPFEMLFR